MKLKIAFLPPPLALAGLDVKMVSSYKELVSIVSLTDVLKYHRFNTLAKNTLSKYCGDDLSLICYEPENIEFINEHLKEYEMVCKKDAGKEEKDDFYSVTGKVHTVTDVNTNSVYVNIFGEGDEGSNLEGFLETITNNYGINTMMSIDAFKKYLIS